MADEVYLMKLPISAAHNNGKSCPKTKNTVFSPDFCQVGESFGFKLWQHRRRVNTVTWLKNITNPRLRRCTKGHHDGHECRVYNTLKAWRKKTSAPALWQPSLQSLPSESPLKRTFSSLKSNPAWRMWRVSLSCERCHHSFSDNIHHAELRRSPSADKCVAASSRCTFAHMKKPNNKQTRISKQLLG